MRLWLSWLCLASLAWASPERHQAWCQLMGVQIPYPQDLAWQKQLELGPPLESVPGAQRAALWGQWSTSQQASQVALAQSLRRSYLLAALPTRPGMTKVKPPFELARPEKLQFDAIVVGSGPCGSVLAYTLVEAGWNVALIEQGPLVLPGSCDPRQVPTLQDAGGLRPSQDGLLLVRNAQVTGGGSSVNVDLAFSPLLEFMRLGQWRQHWGWPAPDEELAGHYNWVREKIGTRSVSTSEINANNQILWDGARSLGFNPRLYDLNTSDPAQLQPGNLDKHSAVERLLFPALQNGLTLLPECEALRILGSQPVKGVEIEYRPEFPDAGIWRDPHRLGWAPGQRQVLRAPRVYLCAGSLGTAKVLKASGLGGSEVGRGMVMHPSFPLIGLFDREIHADRGTPSSVYVADEARSHGLLYECMSGSPDYVGLVLPALQPQLGELQDEFPRLGGFGVMLVDRSRRVNRVEFGPQPALNYQLDPQDARQLAHGVAQACKMMLRAGALKVYLPTTEDVLEDGRPQQGLLVEISREDQLDRLRRRLQFIPGRTLLTSAHMQATCQVGQVVDAQGRVPGCKGLWVMDSSIFPGSVGANPMQSLYTLARAFALRQIRTSLHRALPD